MPHPADPFAPAVQVAHTWLRAIAEALETEDLTFAHRAMRAWMHTVRDRISVASSAHLSAQLPELLRGVYYEGWMPGHVPVRHGLGEFVGQFTRISGVDADDVGSVAGAVTAALSDLFSAGQLDRVFAGLPLRLYEVLCGARPEVAAISDEDLPRADADQVTALHDRVRALGDAVAALAHGLEQLPTDTADPNRAASAAQEAHRILLTEGLIPVSTQKG
ncbi:DUF2267 domain-containing protein [Nocardia sp.]|uniref:DUF2267 domain-containing protein n=1 Tax=Nocardia sp. TaxID=1821 RepID=UPI0025885C30|nr:DUF2267 domain-containing protein [Nocardia sp.]